MQTVDSFTELEQAQVARAYLEGHGVTVSMPDEMAAQTAVAFSAKVGIRLQVPEEQVDMAKDLLKRYHEDVDTPDA